MSDQTEHEPDRGAGYWAMAIVAVLLILFGLPIFAGGLWLIGLGGSWYYAIAGIGLIGSGVLMIRRSMAGFWLYLATYLFTLIWAFWEVGTDWWAQVPRLVAPSIMMIAVLACIPALRAPHARHKTGQSRDRSQAGIVTAGLLFGITLGMAGIVQVALAPSVRAQENPTVTDTGPKPGADATASETGAMDATGTNMKSTDMQASDAQENTRPAQPMAEAGKDWPAWGGSIHATRFSPLDQITPDNVGKLTKVWEFESGDLPSEAAKGKYSPEVTPLKVGETLYMCTPKNVLIAIDAATGEEEWRYDPVVPDDAIPYGATCRGVSFYHDPKASEGDLCADRIIEGTLDARLIAVDSKLGQPCDDFGKDGEVDLTRGIGNSVPGWYGNVAAPVIVRGVVVMGAQVLDGQAEDAPSGVIRGYDAVTGDLAWAWDMCQPDMTGYPPEGKTYTRGTPNMWTSAAGDEDLGYVYVPLGNSAVDYYGGNRKACENEYSSSLVAIDVTTGKEAWHFQTVHYDVWDYDLGSQPTLVDFPTGDGTTPAVILPSKQGQLFVLDRKTGEPLVPVEEREVPTTAGVEPEKLSPTQPYSTYASVDKDRLTERDMWGATPLDQLWCRIQFHRATYQGEYTPPTLETRYLQYPGYNGGSDWGSVAVDTQRNLLIVNYNDMPNSNRLLTREEADKRGLTPVTVPHGEHDNAQAGSPYAVDVNAGWRLATGLMCKEPPYGGIRAIDLATGKTVWDEPIGEARENGPFGIPSMLPLKIGTPNNGGAVVTAGGVTFIAAATDNLIRAIDTETGKVVWTAELPAGGQANPIVFEAGGREFVAIYAGGHHFMETPIGDYLEAWALPNSDNS